MLGKSQHNVVFSTESAISPREAAKGKTKALKMMGLLACSFFLASPAFAVTRYVNQGESVVNALNASVAGDIVHLNAGTHTVPNETVLKHGVTLEGSGVGNTTLRTSATGNGSLILDLDTNDQANDKNIYNGNQEIRDLTFDGNNRTTHHAIKSVYRHNVRILRCNFNNFNHTVITVTGAWWAGGRNNRANGIEIGWVNFNRVWSS